jgi:hypothetical protein
MNEGLKFERKKESEEGGGERKLKMRFTRSWKDCVNAALMVSVPTSE